MRILVFGSFAPSLVNFRGPLLQAMVARGHTVVAVAPDIDEKTATTLQSMGVETANVSLSRKGMNPLRDIAALATLVRQIRQIAPEVILSYTIKPVVYGSIAARLAGVSRIYAMIEGLGYAFNGRGLRRGLLAVVAGLLYAVGLCVCRSVFFLNEDNRRFFQNHWILPRHRRTCLINGTGIDLAHYGPAPLPEDYVRRPVFLCIARLLREKGVVEFVRAAHRVKQLCPDAVFQLVGPFEQGGDSISEADVEAWKSWVEIPGPTDDVRPYIAGCSVYVLPSYHEGVPRTTLEAMSMQRPVITTDAVGCRETVVHGRNGVMVPVGDVEALADAMLRFVHAPELVPAMGEASRRYAEERFDVHKVNAAILQEMELV